MDGGDGRGVPALPLMCGTGDVGRWRSCCGGVSAIFLVGARQQLVCGCNMVISWPARINMVGDVCVHTRHQLM